MEPINPARLNRPGRGAHARGPLMSNTGTEYKYESQATQPFFNNQNTIVMVARSHHGYLMLMHETRIFFFDVENLRI